MKPKLLQLLLLVLMLLRSQGGRPVLSGSHPASPLHPAPILRWHRSLHGWVILRRSGAWVYSSLLYPWHIGRKTNQWLAHRKERNGGKYYFFPWPSLPSMPGMPSFPMPSLPTLPSFRWFHRRRSKLGSRLLSTDQVQAIETLRSELKGWKGRGNKVGLPLSDRHLSRFLRTASWKPHYSDGMSVKQAVMNTISWREKSRAGDMASKSQRSAMTKTGFGPFLHSAGLDKRGRPIVHIYPSTVDHLIGTKNPDRMTEYIVFTMERLELASQKGTGADAVAVGAVAVVDCANCTLGILRQLISVLTPSFPTLATHYPDRLDSVYIVNAGAMESFAWNIMSRFVSETVRNQVNFVSRGNTQQVLRSALGAKHLVKSYGGCKEDFSSGSYFSKSC